MPGPAGGSGGGHRSGGGGFGGGGHRGGGFGGGYGGRGFYGGGFYRRPYGFGGGLLGGILGIILLPAILILFASLFLIINLVNTIGIIADGGQIVYNEEVFQDYAYATYNQHFTDVATYEDGLLIVVLNYEDKQSVSYMAFIGDNVNNRINNAFSSRGDFGRYVESSVNSDNYKYSLSKDLAKVMDYMTERIVNMGLDSSFIDKHDMSGAPEAKFVNKSNIIMSPQTIEGSLARFTDATDIPVYLVVDEGENVFGRTMPVGNIIIAVITLIVIIACIVYIVKKLKHKNDVKRDLGNERIRVNSTGRHSGF